jgi:glycine/D-amino acid oxidase-like deaminating enzyme
MCRKIDAIDFDIAIIGAGAYGLPMAAHVKRRGKKAVHLGGATQLLFGIRGKRWDTDYPHLQPLFNEHWARPLPTETPPNAKTIEAGCYW